MPYNEYYHHHPEHIIGNLDVISLYNRKGLTCKKEGMNAFERLNALIDFIEKQTKTEPTDTLHELKSQVSLLRQELDKLSQLAVTSNQLLQSIHQKIALLEASR